MITVHQNEVESLIQFYPNQRQSIAFLIAIMHVILEESYTHLNHHMISSTVLLKIMVHILVEQFQQALNYSMDWMKHSAPFMQPELVLFAT